MYTVGSCLERFFYNKNFKRFEIGTSRHILAPPHVEPDDLLVLGIDLATHLVVKLEQRKQNGAADDAADDKGEEDVIVAGGHLVKGGLKGCSSGLTTAVHLSQCSK